MFGQLKLVMTKLLFLYIFCYFMGSPFLSIRLVLAFRGGGFLVRIFRFYTSVGGV